MQDEKKVTLCCRAGSSAVCREKPTARGAGAIRFPHLKYFELGVRVEAFGLCLARIQVMLQGAWLDSCV
ncbi:WAP four-disulfide core domain protein 2 [Clarias magur]|uniref:WAP four-disulfide core domain protein 2 n=1 Tax=Clarias magur TaxID=1594786 RepID=A0A8J4X7Z4_CLAMG|nr:WAP four-disulfide core domain protein 2 [Clarias magur]